MAQGDIVIYNAWKRDLMLKVHNMDTDSFIVTLHTGYTPDIDTHVVWLTSGVSSTEYGTASGYTSKTKTVDNPTVTMDTTNDRALWDADDVTWASLGPLSPATPSHAIIHNDTPSSPADPLVNYIVLGTTATNGGNYTLQWSSSPAAIISLT